jgi:hypothetical protein
MTIGRPSGLGVSSGTYALIGVVVGGVLNLLAVAWAERRRDRREVRGPLRHVYNELSTLLVQLEFSIHGGTMTRMLNEFRPRVFERHERALAAALPERTWHAIGAPFNDLDLVRLEMATSADSEGKLTDSEIAKLDRVADGVAIAIDEVLRLTMPRFSRGPRRQPRSDVRVIARRTAGIPEVGPQLKGRGPQAP